MALQTRQTEELMELTLQLRNRKENDEKYAKFRGDSLIGNPTIPQIGTWGYIAAILKHPGALARTIGGLLTGKGIDAQNLASIAGSLSDYSTNRQHLIDGQVKDKYDKMLHPPLTYLGDAFQYRTADGKFNSVINPHLGQAGAPYAKTVPSKTAPLGALPDPADLFDKLMMREEGGRESKSGLSSMLIYHATIIIHDIFRTNDNDKNISDSSSYLDLSPLYGYTDEMQRKVRDGKYKLGLLKPDTFAEDRLLRQPPGVCIMLVMYNRYHNYAARQLARINENGRFSVPRMYSKTKLVCLIQAFAKRDETSGQLDETTLGLCKDYEDLWRAWKAAQPDGDLTPEFKNSKINKDYEELTKKLEALLTDLDDDTRQKFETAYEAAWTKLDDDLFNTARLITCGIYIQISVHDYLRALMGFHQFDTNFTLDPRADFDQKKTSRGIGNQVTVEFNLLYRFHCAISLNDEKYTEEFMKKRMGFADPRNTSLQEFLQTMASIAKKAEEDAKNGIKPPEPWEVTFGIPDDPVNPNAPGGSNGHAAGAPGSSNGHPSGASGSSNGHAAGAPNGKGKAKTKKPKSMNFTRNPITNLFDDDQMLEALTTAMDAPISNFGPRNTPKCLKAVEIMGITQARKWEVGTLNDFREFFGMSRHATFEAVTANVEIQNALRDLYEHPDKIELYPGIFCESDQFMGLDPGPKQQSSALWTAIFSDAITLVRSDRFYTVDWNTNSLTSWGMQEVTPDNSICKSSVFHRLIQRAFPGWLPYNSIRFFHPFYTAEQNAIYAKAQGYGPQFKETQVPEFKLEVTPPEKPNKPWYIDSYDDIHEVLGPKGKNFLNPALYYRENLPKAMADVLDLDQKAPKFSGDIIDQYVSSKEWDLKKYLEDLMRYVIRRESIAMTHATFQIDATRDFAIPVVTRYVADFLGFGDKIRVAASSNTRTYSENEIYQHITNCQIFLSYNTDETKLLKRRNAFKASLVFLSDLTRRGNIFEANQWGFARAIFGKKATNPMSELGVFVAKKVLEYEPDQSKAAAILLLVCLDFAYNAVVSFTATLDSYMKDLYALADLPDTIAASEPPPQWLNVQKLAFSTMPEDSDELEKTIRNAALSIVKIPILRKALVRQNCPFGLVLEGQTVIINLSKAIADAAAKKNGDQLEFLTTQLSIAGKYGVFQPRRLASLALYSMVKFIAQMRNPRRGHDAQGKLKRIRLDKTAEGYYNYMAPMRIRWIQEQVERLPDGDPNKNILTDDLLKPEADTYLTPTWSEFVPFPMTWKIRFDGFGESDYRVGTHPYGRVTSVQLPDYTPPWYQPQGASHVGGSFATVVCICAAAKTHADANAGLHLVNGDSGAMEHESHCPCLGQMTTLPVVARTSLLSTGCGMGERVGHH